MEIVWTAIQILGLIVWSPQHAKAGQYVFQSQDEMAKVWTGDGGKSEQLPVNYDEVGEERVFKEGGKKKDVPKIDFEKNTVVAMFAGEKPSAGHAIKIERVCTPANQDDAWIYVLYRETAPSAAAADVMTYPSHVVVIKKTKGNFKFMNVNTPQGRQFLEQIERAEKKK